MKISVKIRNLYKDHKALNDQLKEYVDNKINSLRANYSAWHYISRVKAIESFALKLETGRGYIQNQKTIEDFFACTLVVENYDAISIAMAHISELFDIVEQRPKDLETTHKAPESFVFDDLRLYCKVKQSNTLKPSAYQEIVFEIQIKTFLQHAWGIATHDLIYKGDNISWGKARIAFQIKAMLEHAELTIKQAEQLSSCVELNRSNINFSKKAEIINIINENWDHEFLPYDISRLADNLNQVLYLLDKDITYLKETLNNGKAANGGSHQVNLSPYATFVSYLINHQKDVLISFSNNRRKKGKIFIDPNIEIPSDLNILQHDKYIIL